MASYTLVTDHGQHTFSDYSFQVDDVGMIKLSHYAGLTQKVPSLFVCVASFQSFNSYTDLPLPWDLETATANFTKFTCRKKNTIKRNLLIHIHCFNAIKTWLHPYPLRTEKLLSGLGCMQSQSPFATSNCVVPVHFIYHHLKTWSTIQYPIVFLT